MEDWLRTALLVTAAAALVLLLAPRLLRWAGLGILGLGLIGILARAPWQNSMTAIAIGSILAALGTAWGRRRLSARAAEEDGDPQQGSRR